MERIVRERFPHTIQEKLKTPKGQLEILRIIFAPIPAVAILVYPWAMMGAIMPIGPGTDDSIRRAYLALFGFTFYLIAVGLIGIKWSNRPLASAILLVPITLANIATLIFFPFIAARIMLFPLGFLGVSLSETIYTILGGIPFGLIFVVAPVLSIWRLFRHAFDMDIPPLEQPIEMWDLKRLNSR